MHSTREYATVQTDFRVDRWDAEQTEWVRAFHGLPRSRTVKPLHFQTAHRSGAGVRPYLTTVDENCNLLTLTGWSVQLGGIAGTSIVTKFSATAGRIGVGTSSTAATATDTSLGGDTGSSSTTSYYQLSGAAPTITTSSAPATLVFTATFGTGNANFAWAEFGTDNGTSSTVTVQSGQPAGTVFINHGISSQGTKASGQTWTATETLSFGFPSGSGTVS